MNDLLAVIRLAKNQRDFYLNQRDRYRNGCPTYQFNDGRYHALRDLVIELEESNGQGLDESAHERYGREGGYNAR